MHVDLLRAAAFALGAAALVSVEREVPGAYVVALGHRLGSVEFAQLVVGLDVGHRIGATRSAERPLVDQNDVFERISPD